MNLRTLLSGRFTGLLLGAVVAASAAFSSACSSEAPLFTEAKTFAGGIQVDAHTLNEGHDAYIHYCYACHGEKGDGRGPSSYGLRPSPRDFTKGIFKFARLRTSDDLPNDEDLVQIVKGGLHGTAMLPWDIPTVELVKIIQYIKTFAPQKWEKKKKSGEPVKTLEPFAPEADPWAGKEADAVQRGKVLYHLKAECMNCHPAYDTKESLYKLSVEVTEADSKKTEKDNFKVITGFREDPYGSVAKDSPEYTQRIIPPDFLFHPVRSIHAPNEKEDLYRLISFGVYPIMPAWKGAGLSDSDIWALAYYVRSLVQMRDTPAAAELKQKLATQAAFEVPPPAPPPAPEPAATEEGKDGEKKDAEKKDGEKKDASSKDASKDAAKKDAPKDGAKK